LFYQKKTTGEVAKEKEKGNLIDLRTFVLEGIILHQL